MNGMPSARGVEGGRRHQLHEAERANRAACPGIEFAFLTHDRENQSGLRGRAHWQLAFGVEKKVQVVTVTPGCLCRPDRQILPFQIIGKFDNQAMVELVFGILA